MGNIVQILAQSIYVCGGKAYASSDNLNSFINNIYIILYIMLVPDCCGLCVFSYQVLFRFAKKSKDQIQPWH